MRRCQFIILLGGAWKEGPGPSEVILFGRFFVEPFVRLPASGRGLSANQKGPLVLLNALTDVRGALQQANAALRAALHK